jgi:hypothetical protein
MRDWLAILWVCCLWAVQLWRATGSGQYRSAAYRPIRRAAI